MDPVKVTHLTAGVPELLVGPQRGALRDVQRMVARSFQTSASIIEKVATDESFLVSFCAGFGALIGLHATARLATSAPRGNLRQPWTHATRCGSKRPEESEGSCNAHIHFLDPQRATSVGVRSCWVFCLPRSYRASVEPAIPQLSWIRPLSSDRRW